MPKFNKPISVIHNGSGGMDKDTSYIVADQNGNPIFNANDYSDALNTRPLSSGQSNSFSNEVILGNGFKVFSIGTQSDQEQICTFNLQEDATSINLTITLFNGSGETLFSAGYFIPNCTYEDYYNQVYSAITGYSGDYSFSAYDPLETFATITNDIGDDFKLLLVYTLNTTTVTNYEYAIITQEAINIGLNNTYLTPISSVDILGDLFILSTTSSEDGVGELGVMTYDGFNYTYTRLLRSIELALGWLHLPEMTGEKNGDTYSIYFVDAHGYDRVIYYNGAFMTDGCINYINPLNQYDYGFIDLQTRQQKFATGTDLVFNSQDENGGNLKSGNYRYALAFYDQAGNRADITLIGNAIEVSLEFWYGSLEGQLTNKINNLYASGINVNVFPTVRLVVVHYLDLAVEIYMLPKVMTTIAPLLLTHTGNEVTETLTAAELGLENNEILHSQNILLLNNRLVKSNFVTSDIKDFSDAAKLLTLSTEVVLSSCEDPYMTSLSVTNEGNYSPNNSQYIGYMDNEGYRIGVKFETTNSNMSPVFWVGDITITPSEMSDYATNGVSLTTSGGTTAEIRNRVIKVANWASFWSAVNAIDSNILRVHIMRTPCVPEVLGTGLGMACVTIGTSGGNTYYAPQAIFDSISPANKYSIYSLTRNKKYVNFVCPDRLMDKAQISYQNGDYIKYVEGLENFGAYTEPLNTSETVKSDRVNNDILNTFQSLLFQYSGYVGANGYTNSTDISITLNLKPLVRNPKATTSGAYQDKNSGDKINISGTDILQQNLIRYFLDVGVYQVFYNTILPSQLLVTLTDIGTKDWGKYIQYIRPLTNKYGDPIENTWVYCGASQDNNVTDELLCFGGDSYIQKTIVKISTEEIHTDASMLPYALTSGNSNMIFSFFSQNRINTTMRGNAGGITALGIASEGTLTWVQALGYFAEVLIAESFERNKQYTARNNEQVSVSYDSTIPYGSNFLARIIYSLVKPVNSLVDLYLSFLPLNYRDLYLTDGAISHMAVDNGELVTWQQRKYMHQYFNNDGLVKSNNTYDLIIGDGSVLSRRGQTISNYGTKLKWSVVKGKSRGGDDVFMFWDTELRAIIKKGAEGINVVSDSDRLNRFLQPMMAIIDKGNTAVLDWGSLLSGTYDQRNKEFVWTARAIKAQYEWAEDVPRAKGDIVYIYPDTDVTFDKLPRVFRSNVNGNISNPLSGVSTDWTELSDVFACFTLVYSLVKEKFTAFYNFRPRLFMQWKDTYLTPSPSEIVTPTPPNNILEIHKDEVFLNDNGRASSFYESIQASYFGFPLEVNATDPYRLDCVGIETWLVNSDVYKYAIWYEPTDTYYYIREVNTDYVVLYEPYTGSNMESGEAKMVLCWSEEPYIEFLTNLEPIAYKRPMALQVHSNLEPVRVDVTTETQETFMTNRNTNNNLESDFTERDNTFQVGVRDDVTNNPTNNTLEGSRLRGVWYKTKVIFRIGETSRINQLVNRLIGVNRNINP